MSLIPIACEFWTDHDGTMTPINFRIEGPDEEIITVKVGKTLDRRIIKGAGRIPSIDFHCRSVINGMIRRYVIHFDAMSMQWYVKQ